MRSLEKALPRPATVAQTDHQQHLHTAGGKQRSEKQFRTPTKVPKNLNADETFPKGKQYSPLHRTFSLRKSLPTPRDKSHTHTSTHTHTRQTPQQHLPWHTRQCALGALESAEQTTPQVRQPTERSAWTESRNSTRKRPTRPPHVTVQKPKRDQRGPPGEAGGRKSPQVANSDHLLQTWQQTTSTNEE